MVPSPTKDVVLVSLKETVLELTDAAQDVEASTSHTNPNAATITEPFDDSSKSEAASEEEEV
ncbi:hypothetical protein A2U01_0101718, partial [Trifolium medium]|nr:hypothetical protein [Trifolium medium]